MKLSPEELSKLPFQEENHNSVNGEATTIPHDSINSPLKLSALKSEPVPNLSYLNS